jgi:hypothetical protein
MMAGLKNSTDKIVLGIDMLSFMERVRAGIWPALNGFK